tara:strand:+ start:414 stop:560 length:147 start_codon:yes stop_codon:yes gene_type:complete
MKIKLFVLATAFAAFLFTGCESTDETPAPAPDDSKGGAAKGGAAKGGE